MTSRAPSKSSAAGERGTRDYSRLDDTAFSRAAMDVTAVVVGAGALGNEVIKNLALLGVRKLAIVDRDRVEQSNLTRSVLFCTADVNDHIARATPKAEFARERVRQMNPDVEVDSYVTEVGDLGAGVLRRADIVFSCVDNEMARLELSWACVRLDKLLVDGGLGLINHSSGMVSVFPGAGGPCYACRKGTARRRQLLQELHGHEDPCWLNAAAVVAAGGVPTTPVMASIVGALQVELALRGAAARDRSTRGRAYAIAIAPEPKLDSMTFERSDGCSLHDPDSQIVNPAERRDRCSDTWSARDLLLESAPAGATLILDWPLTAAARCNACGTQWEPFVRRSRFRSAACPACRGTDLTETTVLSAIDADSPYAGRTLAAIGLPAAHIHEIVAPDGTRMFVEVTGDLASYPDRRSC